MQTDDRSQYKSDGRSPSRVTRQQINERAEAAFYAVAQTFLSEFEDGEPDLYPETEPSDEGDHVFDTHDDRQVACDGGRRQAWTVDGNDHFHRRLGCAMQPGQELEETTVGQAREDGLEPCGSCSRELLNEDIAPVGKQLATDGGREE